MKIATQLSCCIMALALATGCNNADQKSEQTTVTDSNSVQESQLEEMDSIQADISNSVDKLEDKANELEKAMKELDTTAVAN